MLPLFFLNFCLILLASYFIARFIFTQNLDKICLQCHPSYEPKCKTVYKTGYKKYCTVVKELECRTIHKVNGMQYGGCAVVTHVTT